MSKTQITFSLHTCYFCTKSVYFNYIICQMYRNCVQATTSIKSFLIHNKMQLKVFRQYVLRILYLYIQFKSQFSKLPTFLSSRRLEHEKVQQFFDFSMQRIVDICHIAEKQCVGFLMVDSFILFSTPFQFWIQDLKAAIMTLQCFVQKYWLVKISITTWTYFQFYEVFNSKLTTEQTSQLSCYRLTIVFVWFIFINRSSMFTVCEQPCAFFVIVLRIAWVFPPPFFRTSPNEH
eukprot:TRINITY_DN2155_c1_g1_i2.p1 TRINITY_DN2155_c1_g1~~TRINITY_DN2155_c1_g1_i2.p1  ORF type:complete len:233 (+),score=-30.45 TRINITY_DN2155_c1_g1_i2:601-1299(+)